MPPRRDMTWDDWRKEQKLAKAPASGGTRTPVSYRPDHLQGGNIGLPAPPRAESKYTDSRPEQPTPWIDDVDMGANWYSPFEPVWPFGPPNIQQPREWDYPVGFNLNYIPQRMELMQMLRGMRASWGVLATIISTRQDQLLRMPWTIQRRDNPKAKSVAVDEMRKFFRRPDGKNSYLQWTRKLTDDLLVLDAPSIYFARDRRGKPLYAEVLDGATIFPLIDDAGRRPDSVVDISEDGIRYLRRQPAFQQIIKGLPMVDLDESELMYIPMRPRPDLPIFGYPPTEQILIEASEAVRKTFYQLNFWAEGTIPDLIVTVPDTWQPRQIAMFQAHFDALLSGNLQLKSKVRFLPSGMKPFDVKNSSGESLWSQRDETLIRLACYAYSVSPAPFVKMLNRSTAQNAQQMAEEEGLYPLMSYWKDDIIDPIIQERFGYEDIEFIFLPRPEPDAEKQSKIHQIQVREGIRSRNEIRAELGEGPIEGGDVLMIELGNAIIPVASAAGGAALPQPSGGGGDSSSRASGQSPGENSPQRGAAQPVGKSASAEDVQTAAASAAGHLDNLSHHQLSAGNYPKGHVWIQGLDISIENAPGSKRGEKDQSGTKWEVTMPTAYGYIRDTLGADGDQVDVYIGPNPESETVWVIDQNRVSKKGKTKGFDEHKVMLGYKSLKPALRDYLKTHYDNHGHERIKRVTELSMKEFKAWLKAGDTKKPIAHEAGRIVLKQKDLKKSDTISASSGLAWYDQTTAAPKRRRKRKTRPGPRWLNLSANLI